MIKIGIKVILIIINNIFLLSHIFFILNIKKSYMTNF